MKAFHLTWLLCNTVGVVFSATWQFEGAAVQDLGRLDRETLFNRWLPRQLEDGTAPQVQGIFVSYQHEGLVYYFGPFLEKTEAEKAQRQLEDLRKELIQVDPKFNTSLVTTLETDPSGSQSGTSPPLSADTPTPEAPGETSEPSSDIPGAPPSPSGQASSEPTPSGMEQNGDVSEQDTPASDASETPGSSNTQSANEPESDSPSPSPQSDSGNPQEEGDASPSSPPPQKDAPESEQTEPSSNERTAEPQAAETSDVAPETSGQDAPAEEKEAPLEKSVPEPSPTPIPVTPTAAPSPVPVPGQTDRAIEDPSPEKHDEGPETPTVSDQSQERPISIFFIGALIVTSGMLGLFLFLTRQ